MLRSPRILLTALILQSLATLTSSAISAEPDELAVGISGNGVTVLSLWMAQTAGFYKRDGLNVEVINMEGSTRGIQVLLSGKIQIMHAGLGPVFQANRQGANLRIVAATSNRIPFTFFGSRDVKTADDLKGGIVAIGTFGSEGEIAATLALNHLGLSRKDVIMVQVGDFARRFTALLSGQVKATPLVQPASTTARDRGLLPLVDLAAGRYQKPNTPTLPRNTLKELPLLQCQHHAMNGGRRYAKEPLHVALRQSHTLERRVCLNEGEVLLLEVSELGLWFHKKLICITEI